MDATTQIAQFQQFIEQGHHPRLLELVRKGIKKIVFDFDDLSRFDPELANFLLEEPENTIKACELAIEQLEGVKGFTVRFRELPAIQQKMIRHLRSEHLAKYLQMTGIVRQKSDVRPQITSARFECPSCGNIISVLQLDAKFREPDRCGCGRKGKFRLLSKELVDAQKIVLEEAPDMLEGGEQPKRLDIFLRRDLVAPITDARTNPGSKVVVTGYLKEVPIAHPQGGQLTRYDLMLETNHIEPVEEDYSQIEISEEEEAEIRAIAKQDFPLGLLTKSLAPSVYGHDKIKEAMVLQMLGGVQKKRSDGVTTRGDIHILLVGDPGAGKCVSGDSNISLGDGRIVKMQEFFESTPKTQESDDAWIPNEPIHLPVLDLDGEMHQSKVTRLWKRAAHKTLKITTKSGNVLNVTENHPLFITANGYITGVPAENIRTGMRIATPKTLPGQYKAQFIEQKEITQRTAWLLGALAGDGCLTVPGAIDFTNNNPHVLDEYVRSLQTLTDKPIQIMQKAGTSAKRPYLFDKKLYATLKTHVPELLHTAAHKSIPQKILQSHNHVLGAFIGGLYDTDGHCNKTKREIEITLKSKELIDQLKIALLRFGILSCKRPVEKAATNAIAKQKHAYYRLTVRGKHTQTFLESITTLSRKFEALPVKSTNSNIDTVPNIAGLLLTLRKAHGLSQFDFDVSRSSYQHYERGSRSPSYAALQTIYRTYKDSKHPLVSVLKEIAHADIHWDEVVSVEYEETPQTVYDFEVEHVHNFIANACIVHNSQLLKRGQHVAPKSRFVSGKGASGAGLTASVVRDEFIRGWALEAGALVLANKGQIFIDELDKMTPEDRSAFHEALEQQQVTISKANIQATLRCETTVLAAANPKFGRFDPYELLAKQIELPSTLINRFDLIFPVRDLPSEEKDRKLASFVLQLHQTGDIQDVPIETNMLTKYISYARSRVFPKLSDEAIEEIQKFYVEMRNSAQNTEGISAIPISARQLEALVRLSEASARARLDAVATRDDAKRAIELIMYCLQQLGVDPDTGKLDIDRLTTGVTASSRNQVHLIKQIIRELADMTGDPLVPEEDILAKAQEQGITEDKAEEVLEKLNRLGDIFRPKPGFYSMMK